MFRHRAALASGMRPLSSAALQEAGALAAAGLVILLAVACGGGAGVDTTEKFDAFFRLRLARQLVATATTESYQLTESQCETPLEQQVRGRIGAGERKRLEGEGALLLCQAAASAGITAGGASAPSILLSVTLYESAEQGERGLDLLWGDFVNGLGAAGAEIQAEPVDLGAPARALVAVADGQASFAVLFTRGEVLLFMTAVAGDPASFDFEDLGELAALLDRELLQRSD